MNIKANLLIQNSAFKIQNSFLHLYIMKFYFKMFGFACLLAIVSCSKNNSETTVIDNGYSYFPIDSIKQYLYVVDSISYSNSTNVDTFHFHLKIQFVISFIDLKGTKTWRLQRFAKYENQDSFREIENHFLQFKNNQLIYTANNLNFLKAVFPLNKNTVWNGNLYNTDSRVNTKIDLLNETFTNSDTIFTNALKITEKYSEDFIFSIEQWSVYQNNKGLVYYKSKNIETQTDQNGKESKSGFDITQKLVGVIE
jgi:hypothetical protein